MRVPRHERRLATLAALLAAAALSMASPAMGDAGHTIVERCILGKSLSGFTQSAYGKAIKELSATTEEYSDCASLIRQAQAAAAATHSSGSNSPAETAAPTAIAATPAEQSEIAGVAHTGAGPVDLDGHEVHPGVVHANVASTFSTLPASLLVALAFLVVCLLVIGGGVLRNRVRDGRTD